MTTHTLIPYNAFLPLGLGGVGVGVGVGVGGTGGVGVGFGGGTGGGGVCFSSPRGGYFKKWITIVSVLELVFASLWSSSI